MREGMVVFAAIIIMQTLIVYIHPNACASQFIETLGIAPLQFLLSVMLTARSWYAAPITQQPKQLLTSEKQQFAWCEGDLARTMAQRGCADTEPMFCFESALRALFWTIAAYRETQVCVGAMYFCAIALPNSTLSAHVLCLFSTRLMSHHSHRTSMLESRCLRWPMDARCAPWTSIASRAGTRTTSRRWLGGGRGTWWSRFGGRCPCGADVSFALVTV